MFTVEFWRDMLVNVIGVFLGSLLAFGTAVWLNRRSKQASEQEKLADQAIRRQLLSEGIGSAIYRVLRNAEDSGLDYYPKFQIPSLNAPLLDSTAELKYTIFDRLDICTLIDDFRDKINRMPTRWQEMQSARDSYAVCSEEVEKEILQKSFNNICGAYKRELWYFLNDGLHILDEMKMKNKHITKFHAYITPDRSRRLRVDWDDFRRELSTNREGLESVYKKKFPGNENPFRGIWL